MINNILSPYKIFLGFLCLVCGCEVDFPLESTAECRFCFCFETSNVKDRPLQCSGVVSGPTFFQASVVDPTIAQKFYPESEGLSKVCVNSLFVLLYCFAEVVYFPFSVFTCTKIIS